MKPLVLIAGRGAVGLTMGELLVRDPDIDFAFLADAERKARYQTQTLRINGQEADLPVLSPQDARRPAALILFACKSYSLAQAMEEAAPFVDENTIFMSAINGMKSEDMLRKRYPDNPVIHCIAQKMDARYDAAAQTLSFTTRGELVYGPDDSALEAKAQTAAALLHNLPLRRSDEIVLDQARKLMANCGLNQICAVYGKTYGDIARDPQYHQMFADVMEETRQVLAAKGMDPGEQALKEWLEAVKGFDPDSMPSMAQDVLAGRPLETDLFSGYVVLMAHEENIPVPLLEDLLENLNHLS